MVRLKGWACALIMLVTMTSNIAIAENILRWASAGGPGTFDPHAYNETPTTNEQRQVYETLVGLDSDHSVAPLLATSWRLLEPNKWQFKLRENVRFHDGSPFTAEDVVFSFDRAKSDTSQMSHYLGNVKQVTALDSHTVNIETLEPALLLPLEIRLLFIMPKEWSEKYGVARPEDIVKNEVSHARNHTNGTGPFVLQEFLPGVRTILIRNDDWWGFSNYPHNIDKVVHESVADARARLTMLLDGKIDLLVGPPLEALDDVKSAPGFIIEQTMNLRNIFLGFNIDSPELASSDVAGMNPFQDKRVRQAMYLAIDIKKIKDDVMNGLSIPAGMFIQPGIIGYSPDLDKRLPHDLEAARELLEQAGYDAGFAVTLNCPNNRYVNDEEICRALSEQWREIGIEVSVDALPKAEHFRKVFDRQTDFWMQG